jgi:hypothetical protein
MGSLDHPPKIGKTGAQKIKALLAKESESLAANTEKLAEALAADRKTFDPNAVPGGALDAIRGIRGYYQGLRSDIADVKTSATDAKKDILGGLDDIDEGYKGFAKGLKKHVTPEGIQGMKRGQALAAAGTKQLRAGRKAL